MGVPYSEVGYTPSKPRREDHEVHKGLVVALGGGGNWFSISGTYTTHKKFEGLKAKILGAEPVGILGSNCACKLYVYR